MSMRAALARATLLIVLGTAALLAAPGSSGQASGWDRSAAEATLWSLVNGARVNAGLAPLQQHPTLLNIARWRSSDMLERDYFSHVIAGTGQEVYHWYDLNGLIYRFAAENIAWNSGLSDARSPVRAHERFMESSFHRGNILNPAFTHGAVGAHGAEGVSFQGATGSVRVYTELFMQAPGGAAPPPQPPPAPAPAPVAPEPTVSPAPPAWTDPAWQAVVRERVQLDGSRAGSDEAAATEPPARDETERAWLTVAAASGAETSPLTAPLLALTAVVLAIGPVLGLVRRSRRPR